MTKKETIYQKLKELFSLTAEKFDDATLKDGSILRGDMKPGAKMQLVSADGTVNDAPDSEYECADGTKISIKGGVIDTITPAVAAVDGTPAMADATEVKPVDEPMAKETKIPAIIEKNEADATPAVETPAADTDSEMDGMLPQIVADLADRVGALEKALGDAKMANMEMSKQLEKFAKEPAAKPIVRTQSQKFERETKKDFMNNIEALKVFRTK
jgi:hypothetical protein